MTEKERGGEKPKKGQNLEKNLGAKPIVKQFLLSTSVKGVGRIVKSSGDSCARTLWILTVLFGSSMSFYFLYRLFSLYVSRAVTTVLSEKQQKGPFPDVTICNLNPAANIPNIEETVVRFSPLLDQIIDRMNDKNISDERYEYLDYILNTMLEPASVIQNVKANLSEVEAGIDFIIDCKWLAGGITEMVTSGAGSLCMKEKKLVFNSPEYGFCYTFSSELNTIQGLTAILFLGNFLEWHMPSFRMSFSQPFSAGVRVAVHERGTLPVMSKGINVPAGHHTTVRLHVNHRKLLPLPYTNCTENKVLHGFEKYKYSKSACEELCWQERVMKECGCVSGYISSLSDMRDKFEYCRYFGNGSFDDVVVAMLDKLDCAEDIYNDDVECVKEICLPACDEYRYSLKTFQTPWPHPSYRLAFFKRYVARKPYSDQFKVYQKIADLSDEEEVSDLVSFGNATDNETQSQVTSFQLVSKDTTLTSNFLQINVIFDSDTVSTYTDTQAVTLESLIGSLGGVLNLWIGVSFVTLVELIDLAIKLCRLGFYEYVDRKHRDKETKLSLNQVDPVEKGNDTTLF